MQFFIDILLIKMVYFFYNERVHNNMFYKILKRGLWIAAFVLEDWLVCLDEMRENVNHAQRPKDAIRFIYEGLKKFTAQHDRVFSDSDAYAYASYVNGVKASDFPPLPVDYGYRDSKNFWFHRKTRMRAELLQMRQASLESVRYAADRVDDKVKFTDDALQTVLNVPRVFLPLVLKGCVDWAKENNVELITAEQKSTLQWYSLLSD